jgi:hypothetical protein
MQARTHRDAGFFDRAVESLRAHFDMLQQVAVEKMATARA